MTLTKLARRRSYHCLSVAHRAAGEPVAGSSDDDAAGFVQMISTALLTLLVDAMNRKVFDTDVETQLAPATWRRAWSNVIISVPYMWPEKSSRYHIHDLINEETLKSWTGREPSHSVVAQEVVSPAGKSRRLVAYYQNPSRPFSIHQVPRNDGRSSRRVRGERTCRFINCLLW